MAKAVQKHAIKISFVIIVLAWIFKTIWSLQRVDKFQALEHDPTYFFRVVTFTGIFTLLLIAGLLWLNREGASGLYLHTKGIWKQIGIGILSGILIFFVSSFLISPVFDSFLPSNGIDLSKLFTSKAYIPIWIALAIFKGGFQEELWRVFVLTRFEKWQAKSGLIVALILGSAVFGISHIYQGWDTVASTATLGLIFGLLFLYYRSALIPIIAHAVFDLIAISFAFSMYLP